MNERSFQVLIERDVEAGLWVTHVPLLNGLSTYGESRAEALANTSEAIVGYLEAAEKEGIQVPELAELIELQVAVA